MTQHSSDGDGLIIDAAHRWHDARKACLECEVHDVRSSGEFRARLNDLADAESALAAAVGLKRA